MTERSVGIVHADGQALPDARNRHQRTAAGIAAVDEPAQAGVDRHPIEVEERDVQLDAERLPHRLVGDVVETNEELADRQLQLRLLFQGVLQLFGGDRTAAHQHLAKLRPLVGALEHQVQLALRHEVLMHQQLAERHVRVAGVLLFEHLAELGLRDQTLAHEHVAETELRRLFHGGSAAISIQPGISPLHRWDWRRMDLRQIVQVRTI